MIISRIQIAPSSRSDGYAHLPALNFFFSIQTRKMQCSKKGTLKNIFEAWEECEQGRMPFQHSFAITQRSKQWAILQVHTQDTNKKELEKEDYGGEAKVRRQR